MSECKLEICIEFRARTLSHNLPSHLRGKILMHLRVNDCNVPAIDLLLAEACDFGALHHMLTAWMVACEPLRRRVDIDKNIFLLSLPVIGYQHVASTMLETEHLQIVNV